MNWSARNRETALVLAGSGMVLFAIAAAALLRFPLLETYNVQILTLEEQVVAQPTLGPALTLGIGLAFGSYVAGYLALRQAEPHGRHTLLIACVLIPPLASGFALLFIHPTSSLDLYDYLYRGHMAAQYGANSFVQTPEDLRSLDRLYWYTAWRRSPTAYGPLWELISVGVARIAGPNLFNLILGFKLVSFAGWLATAGAIAVATPPGVRLLGLYLWLWNPLALWELAGAGHNDGVMLAWIMIAMACLRRRPLLALTLITVAALFKYVAALLWLPALAAILAQTPGWRERLSLTVQAGLVSAALVLIAYAPWWAGSATLEQFAARRELVSNTPFALYRAFVREHIPHDVLLERIGRMTTTLLVLGVAAATWLSARRPQATTLIGCGLLLWFQSVGTAWFQPWYLTWPLALAALHPRVGQLGGLLGALSLGALLTYPAFAALQPWLNWPLKEAPWQALILALLYGPPLLALAWLRRPRATQSRLLVTPQQQEAT